MSKKSLDTLIKEKQTELEKLKQKRKKLRKMQEAEIGKKVYQLLPEIAEKFNEENFNLENYLKLKLGLNECINDSNFDEKIDDYSDLPF